jgi:hypothetical protein
VEQIFTKILGVHPKKEYNAFQKTIHRVILMFGSDIEISDEKRGK